jgi:hypothetical protein
MIVPLDGCTLSPLGNLGAVRADQEGSSSPIAATEPVRIFPQESLREAAYIVGGGVPKCNALLIMFNRLRMLI